jgi:hypothetical protein
VAIQVEIVVPEGLVDRIDSLVVQKDSAQDGAFGFQIMWKRFFKADVGRHLVKMVHHKDTEITEIP